jgi:Tol biopolymer transport system component/predicted Ser/Thr protein kinase
MALAAGTKLGPYEILAPIGAGGMGEVYKARDTKLDRDVAIKVLPAMFADDPERLGRFEREAKVLASLNHPNIASIYGVEERALVMEFVEGESPRGPMAFEDAWKICAQVAAALEYAHERRVIHRDLKPANIKVTPDGRVKILDFGLAKAITEESARPAVSGVDSPTLTMGATQAGVILGTAAYMAPEQVRGKVADRRADIWAFGVVLYELLTGERLFRGSDSSETMARVLTEEPNLDRAPANVRPLLRECLKKDPAERLRHIEAAEYLLEGAVESPVQATNFRRKLPWTVAAALGVVAGALGFLYVLRTPRPAQPLTRFSVDLGPDAAAGFSVTAVISPDGRRLVFVARGANGREQLATRLLEQTNYNLLPGTENANDPFFSPDSQWIGFFADGKMKKISVQGGATATLCNAPNGRGASWGEDGNIIATLDFSAGAGLSRVSETGGTPQALSKPGPKGDASDRWPQILPGGQTVLFTATAIPGAYDDATIYALSLKTGQKKMVQRGGYFGRYLPSGHLVYVHLGTLLAVPFDLDRLEVRGVPVPILEDVAGNTAYGAGQFTFSRTGSFVYLSGKYSGQYPIAWLNSTGKMQTLLAAPGNYFGPRFSPDGKRLAVSVSLSTMQVYDWQRDVMARLSTGQLAMSPVWAPDGKHIAFGGRVDIESYGLGWIRSDGAREAQRLLNSKNLLRPYSFSPDGKNLAYTEDNPETGSDLWTLPLDLSDPEHPKAGKPEQFLATPAPESEPAFSPDGHWIAYRSQEAGGSEIQVRPFPGPGAKYLVSTAPAVHPIWSGNGRELFFENPTDNRIWVATYTAKGDTFFPDRPKVWYEGQIFEPNIQHWNLDLAPDGKRFAVFPGPDAGDGRTGSVHVTVLLNFFDELTRRVPNRN